ncbi:hypothetical protein DFH09DRAFT_1150721 [Mycena vulgaris]|nr:hypothetical protein DFH09DRAFT_1150721 [Mycena vulgaris]
MDSSTWARLVPLAVAAACPPHRVASAPARSTLNVSRRTHRAPRHAEVCALKCLPRSYRGRHAYPSQPILDVPPTEVRRPTQASCPRAPPSLYQLYHLTASFLLAIPPSRASEPSSPGRLLSARS